MSLICAALLAALCILPSCRGELILTENQTLVGGCKSDPIRGFFLLNQGAMGTNKCTIDYYDYADGVYTRNIFPSRNPSVALSLGDLGNDVKIYGDRIFAVINGSNLIEVMNASTAEHIAQISVPNCRYITFDGDFAYVTSYVGSIGVDPTACLGEVYKISLKTLEVVGTCTVGYQPEGLAVAAGKLYVANSGAYRYPNYDNTVSVIDLATFKEIKKIEVAVNLNKIIVDAYGCLWISSWGDYYMVPSATYVVDTATDKLVATMNDLPNGNMVLAGDNLYVYSSVWNYTTQTTETEYYIADIKSHKVVKTGFLDKNYTAGIASPYCLAVNPVTGEIFVGDAADYVTPGILHCFAADGTHKWSVLTGDLPAAIVFTEKTLQ